MTTAPDHAAATDFALVAAKGETVLRGGPAPDYVQNLARAYLDATEWRTDFENAPHDGSHFMAYSGRDGILYTMHFSDGRMLTDNEFGRVSRPWYAGWHSGYALPRGDRRLRA